MLRRKIGIKGVKATPKSKILEEKDNANQKASQKKPLPEFFQTAAADKTANEVDIV